MVQDGAIVTMAD